MIPNRSDAEEIRYLRLREMAVLRQRIQVLELQRFSLIERLAAYQRQVDSIDRGDPVSHASPLGYLSDIAEAVR